MRTYNGQSQHTGEDNPFHRITRVLFWSGLFWAMMALSGLMAVLLNFGSSLWFENAHGAWPQLFAQGLIFGSLLIIVSVGVGLCCAIPSVLFIVLISRDEYVPVGRRSWNVRTRRRIQNALAILLTLSVHLVVLLVNVFAAPQFVRQLFPAPNSATETLMKVHQSFFAAELAQEIELFDEYFSQIKPEGILIFLPDAVADRASLLVETRRLLGEPVPFLLSHASDVKKHFESAQDQHPLSVLAAHQPHVFYFFKKNLLSILSPHWHWKRIVDDSLTGLHDKMLKELKTPQVQQHFLTLSLGEYEFLTQEKEERPLPRPWLWRAPLSASEIEVLLSNVDRLMANLIQKAWAHQVKKIAVVPWQSSFQLPRYVIRPSFVSHSLRMQDKIPLFLQDVAKFNSKENLWVSPTRHLSLENCQPFRNWDPNQGFSILCRHSQLQSVVFQWKSARIIEDGLLTRLQSKQLASLRERILKIETADSARKGPLLAKTKKSRPSAQTIQKTEPPTGVAEKILESEVDVFAMNPQRTSMELSLDKSFLKSFQTDIDRIVSQFALSDGSFE